MAKLQNRPMNDIIARYQIIKNIKNMEQMNYPEELDDVFLKKIMKKTNESPFNEFEEDKEKPYRDSVLKSSVKKEARQTIKQPKE